MLSSIFLSLLRTAEHALLNVGQYLIGQGLVLERPWLGV